MPDRESPGPATAMVSSAVVFTCNTNTRMTDDFHLPCLAVIDLRMGPHCR